MENDFWKEKLNYYQQMNMTKKEHSFLHMEDAIGKINEFTKKFPLIHTELNQSDSYITWEAYVSSTVKLRFYIQSQIKISFMQKIDGVFTKVADAKFPYDPFTEIEDLFTNQNSILDEFDNSRVSEQQLQKQQRITYEFIKANLSLKINPNIIYHIECRQKDFLLVMENYNGQEKNVSLTAENFRQVINNL